jgi:hypothetical protein
MVADSTIGFREDSNPNTRGIRPFLRMSRQMTKEALPPKLNILNQVTSGLRISSYGQGIIFKLVSCVRDDRAVQM